MLIKSNTSGLNYNTENVIFISNIKQSSMYIKHGAQIVDLFYDEYLTFVFNKVETKNLHKAWKEYTLT